MGLGYRWFFRPYFFKRDPEDVHDLVLGWGKKLGKNRVLRWLVKLSFGYSHKALEQKILGIYFKNPIGLAAGFDKNSEIVDVLGSLGFGFGEVGSVTGRPCLGNVRPRLWRLVKEKSLLVYYGLKNDGAVAVCSRLRGSKTEVPVGISVAKTNSRETVDLEAGVSDYLSGFKECLDVGEYIAINISCPNAFGGQPFHDTESFKALFAEIDRVEMSKPVLVKISPDLSSEAVDKIIELSRNYKIDGFVVSNLTKRLEVSDEVGEGIPERGGIGGKLLEGRANELISYIYGRVKDEFIIIGCGGVDSAEGAYEKIKRGASLVQLITGMIYEGPQLIGSINEGLVRLLKKDGYKSISEAVGADNR